MMDLMKYSIVKNTLAVFIACCLAIGASLALAQQGQSVGRVEEINQRAEFIKIDGKDYSFDPYRITLYYKGDVVDSSYLIPGLRVRYNTFADGYIREVHMLAPINIIEMMLTD